MSSVYLFDVDGTLTPPKAKIDPTFATAFLKWMKTREVYIVSGGSFVRIIEQLGIPIMNEVHGVFACMANTFYQRRDQVNYSGMNEWDLLYENEFISPRNLVRSLNAYVAKSNYHTKTGRHLEERAGMLNFSIVGRNASAAQRANYAGYDAEHNERKRIVKALAQKYTELEFVIGGAVSIDIFNRGNDKSQIIDRYFREALQDNEIHFVGDRIPFPGNDHTIAQVLSAHPNGTTHEVENWQDTAELLKTEPFA